MTDPTTRRRFDDDEVSLIIRRAGELQESQGSGGDAGMTLADLEAVAREAGLDPALVRRAAAELDERHPSSATRGGGARFLGAPTVLRFERVVERALGPEDHEAAVDEIRRALDDVGTVSVIGRTLAWSSSPAARPGQQSRAIQVTVATRGGRSAIRVEEAAGGLAGALFGGIVGGVGGGGSGIAVGIGLAVMHSVPAAAGIWAALLAGSYALARTIFTGLMRRRAAQLASLADRLAALGEP